MSILKNIKLSFLVIRLIKDDYIIPPRCILSGYIFKKCQTKGFEVKRWALLGMTHLLIYRDGGMEDISNIIPISEGFILASKIDAWTIKIVNIYREYEMRYDVEEECTKWYKAIVLIMNNHNYDSVSYTHLTLPTKRIV